MLCHMCNRESEGKSNCEFCGAPFQAKGTTIMQDAELIRPKEKESYSKKEIKYIGAKWAAIASPIFAVLSFLVMPFCVPAVVLGMMGLKTKLGILAIIGGLVGLFTTIFYIVSIILIVVGAWSPEFLS